MSKVAVTFACGLYDRWRLYRYVASYRIWFDFIGVSAPWWRGGGALNPISFHVVGWQFGWQIFWTRWRAIPRQLPQRDFNA